MSCQEMRELFTARADDALGDDARARLDAHLATCADCAREWTGFARTVALLRAVTPARAPAGFVDRVLAARPRPWYRRLIRGLLVPWPVKLPVEAAAIVLIAGLAVLVFQRSPDMQQAAREPAPPSSVTTPPPPAERPRADAPPPPLARSPTPQPPGQREVSRAPEAPSPAAPADTAPSSRVTELSRQEETRARSAEGDASATKNAAGERAPQRAGEVQRLGAAPELQARLAVTEPVEAERAVHDLVARAGGRVVSRAEADGAIVLGLSVPGDRWEELRRGLQALGALRLEGRSPDAAGPLRIGLRLER